ncbi:MAG: DUF559 domain-containing protein [Deltaproteobacteria bacterium]|nr:DUF559 domain-containing protein [Deltaproteobacteria bacterium]
MVGWDWTARARADLVEKARQQRRAQTSVEGLLWSRLRRRAFCGLKFRRKHPIAQFIVDFYAPSLRLALELDDAQMPEYDAYRQRFLEALGMTVLRVDAAQAERDVEAVLLAVLDAVNRDAPSGRVTADFG